MLVIAGVRQAEPWNLGNVIGGVTLAAVAVIVIVLLIRRYLDT
jgi:hypothetical protein